MATLNSNVPPGPLADKWRNYKANIKLVNPANKRKYEIVIVGAGIILYPNTDGPGSDQAPGLTLDGAALLAGYAALMLGIMYVLVRWSDRNGNSPNQSSTK